MVLAIPLSAYSQAGNPHLLIQRLQCLGIPAADRQVVLERPIGGGGFIGHGRQISIVAEIIGHPVGDLSLQTGLGRYKCSEG